MRRFGRRGHSREGGRIPLLLLAAILLLVLQCPLPAVVLAGEDEAGRPASPDLEVSLLLPRLLGFGLAGVGEPLAPLPSEDLGQLLLSRGPVRPRPPPLG